MATPVLHYFPAKGRAEAIRLAFALGGIKFEDHRFPGSSKEEEETKKENGGEYK